MGKYGLGFEDLGFRVSPVLTVLDKDYSSRLSIPTKDCEK